MILLILVGHTRAHVLPPINLAKLSPQKTVFPNTFLANLEIWVPRTTLTYNLSSQNSRKPLFVPAAWLDLVGSHLWSLALSVNTWQVHHLTAPAAPESPSSPPPEHLMQNPNTPRTMQTMQTIRFIKPSRHVRSMCMFSFTLGVLHK